MAIGHGGWVLPKNQRISKKWWKYSQESLKFICHGLHSWARHKSWAWWRWGLILLVSDIYIEMEDRTLVGGHICWDFSVILHILTPRQGHLQVGWHHIYMSKQGSQLATAHRQWPWQGQTKVEIWIHGVLENCPYILVLKETIQSGDLSIWGWVRCYWERNGYN